MGTLSSSIGVRVFTRYVSDSRLTRHHNQLRTTPQASKLEP